MAQRPTPEPPTPLRVAIVFSGLKQREVAEATGIRVDTLSKIVNERVRPNDRERAALAQVLGRDESALWPETTAEAA